MPARMELLTTQQRGVESASESLGWVPGLDHTGPATEGACDLFRTTEQARTGSASLKLVFTTPPQNNSYNSVTCMTENTYTLDKTGDYFVNGSGRFGASASSYTSFYIRCGIYVFDSAMTLVSWYTEPGVLINNSSWSTANETPALAEWGYGANDVYLKPFIHIYAGALGSTTNLVVGDYFYVDDLSFQGPGVPTEPRAAWQVGSIKMGRFV